MDIIIGLIIVAVLLSPMWMADNYQGNNKLVIAIIILLILFSRALVSEY